MEGMRFLGLVCQVLKGIWKATNKGKKKKVALERYSRGLWDYALVLLLCS